MNNFSFENQGTNTYLVYRIGEGDTIDTMTLGMLTNNKIPGLANTIFAQLDATKYLKYNVSSKVSAGQFFAGPVNKKRIIGVFNGIIQAMLSAEEYMIDANSIILDLDYIFADVSTCETTLICVPVVGSNAETDLGAFFKKIMFSTQFDPTENCDHVAKIMNYLNSAPAFSLIDFQKVLKSLSEEGKKTGEKKPTPAVSAATPQRHTQPTVSSHGHVAVLNQQIQQPEARAAAQQTTPAGTVPQNQIPTPPPKVENTQDAENKQKMSFMYLMRHYSKENAEIYKSQKNAEKSTDKSTPASKEKEGKGKGKQKSSAADNQVEFSVPGTPIQTSFAVPGQPNQAQLSGGGSRLQGQQSVTKQVAQLPEIPTASANTSGGGANFGNTTVLGDPRKVGETTVLNATSTVSELRPMLVRMKNNEKILINKPVYRIGKERSYVDYFIGDNSAISRSHANIVSRDGAYFVVDTNSTNHTYVNGEMIQSNLEVQLTNGTKIRLANEDFEFKLV